MIKNRTDQEEFSWKPYRVGVGGNQEKIFFNLLSYCHKFYIHIIIQYSPAVSVAAAVRCRDMCVEYFLNGGLVKVLQKDERRRQHNEPQATAAAGTGAQTSASATM